jgi:hypothetical protein
MMAIILRLQTIIHCPLIAEDFAYLQYQKRRTVIDPPLPSGQEEAITALSRP